MTRRLDWLRLSLGSTSYCAKWDDPLSNQF